jgi:hypothetical protein
MWRRAEGEKEMTAPILTLTARRPGQYPGRRNADASDGLREYPARTHAGCVYRKLKLGRSGGEVRQGWRVI